MRTVPRIYFFTAVVLVDRLLLFCQSKLINSRFYQFGEMIDCQNFEINERENNTTMYRYMVSLLILNSQQV